MLILKRLFNTMDCFNNRYFYIKHSPLNVRSFWKNQGKANSDWFYFIFFWFPQTSPIVRINKTGKILSQNADWPISTLSGTRHVRQWANITSFRLFTCSVLWLTESIENFWCRFKRIINVKVGHLLLQL